RPDLPSPLPSRSVRSGQRAVVGQHDPSSASAGGVLLHAVLRDLRSEAPRGHAGELGAAVSDPRVRRRCLADRSAGRAARIVPGRELGALAFALYAGGVFVFCSDGVFEAMRVSGEEFSAARLIEVVKRSRELAPGAIVDAIFDAVESFREGAPPNDDMTAVAV